LLLIMPVTERICGTAATRDETVIVNNVCRSLDQEGRTSQNQIKFFKQSLVLRWHGVALGYLSKECLHLVGGCLAAVAKDLEPCQIEQKGHYNRPEAVGRQGSLPAGV
jgi:hypothetical protein